MAAKIFNVMFQKSLGGIEQAFLDYSSALYSQNYQVINLVHPSSLITRYMNGHYMTVNNFSKYDIFAILKLQKLVYHENPYCIITHGGRAANLIKKLRKRPPFIAVSHNYNFKPVLGSDAVITTTEDMRSKLTSYTGHLFPIYQLPNMIDISKENQFIEPNFRFPHVIGTICRFSKEKGIDVLLRAAHILKLRNIPFKLILAGDGEEKNNIQKMVADLGLKNQVEMPGWIDTKHEFYDSIDIFCMLSYSEAFGITMLEAFKYSKPTIVTMTAGPLEIATHNQNALFVPVGNHSQVAEYIIELLNNPNKAKLLAESAFHRVQDYSSTVIAKKLSMIVEQVCTKPKIAVNREV